jgi:hypothetical protein
MASSAPTALNTKLPSGRRRSAGLPRAVTSIASTPCRRWRRAPARSATDSGSMPCAASVAVSSTMARLEYDSTVSTAPTKMSSSTSLGSATSRARTAGDAVSGRVAPTISCSASVISPRPISTRPTRPADGAVLPDMNITTPTKISSGDSHDRSNEKTTAISAVPTSAPSITASAAAVGDQARADEGGDDQAGGGAALHQAGHPQPGKRGGETVAEAARQHAAQVLRRTPAAPRCARCACPTRAGQSRPGG